MAHAFLASDDRELGESLLRDSVGYVEIKIQADPSNKEMWQSELDDLKGIASEYSVELSTNGNQ